MEHLYVLDIVPRAMLGISHTILTTTSSYEEYYTNEGTLRYKELAQGQSAIRELKFLTKFFLGHHHSQYCPKHHMS